MNTLHDFIQSVSLNTSIIVRRNYKEVFRGRVTSFDSTKPLAKAIVFNIGVKYDDYDDRAYLVFNVDKSK